MWSRIRAWLNGQRRWEYLILPLTSGDEDVDPDLMDHQQMISALGISGWELVSVYQNHFVFKKPC